METIQWASFDNGNVTFSLVFNRNTGKIVRLECNNLTLQAAWAEFIDPKTGEVLGREFGVGFTRQNLAGFKARLVPDPEDEDGEGWMLLQVENADGAWVTPATRFRWPV